MMEQYFRMIEQKLKEAGYPADVAGEEIYDEICDQIEDKEPGTYLFLSKKSDTEFFEYKIEVFEEDFNLSYIDIHTSGRVIHVDFD